MAPVMFLSVEKVLGFSEKSGEIDLLEAQNICAPLFILISRVCDDRFLYVDRYSNGSQ
jgi:hypothetical protein